MKQAEPSPPTAPDSAYFFTARNVRVQLARRNDNADSRAIPAAYVARRRIGCPEIPQSKKPGYIRRNPQI